MHLNSFHLSLLGLFFGTVASAAAVEPMPVLPVMPAPVANTTSEQDQENTQFVSAVQFAVRETSPELLVRSHRLVRQQFAQSLEVAPELRGKQFEVKTNGNEMVFYFVTQNDMRNPMQVALSDVVQQLNGRVQARGRSMFYRTALSQPLGGYLETVVDDSHSQVVAVTARAVPLRDLLKQLKTQMTNLSYLVPGDCAELPVDWSYTGLPENAKSIDSVMEELASLFTLGYQKKNGTHIFSGACKNNGAPTRMGQMPRAEMMRIESSFMPIAQKGQPFFRQVYLPIAPLGE